MGTITFGLAPTVLASVLARSAETGDLDRLEVDLAHTRAALRNCGNARGSAWQEETSDLLSALAGEMSATVRRCRENGQDQWNAGTFPAYLLHHVASAARR